MESLAREALQCDPTDSEKYIYIYKHIHIYICICLHVYCVCACVCVYIYTHTYIHTHMHTYVRDHFCDVITWKDVKNDILCVFPL
jgi:hypothetical protein